MFPFDISGTVRIPATMRNNSATVKAVATRLAAMLDEKDVSDVYIEGARVRFHNKWFGGTLRFGFDSYSQSFLAEFGSGTFDIEAAIDGITVRFNLSLTRMWIVLAVFVAIFRFLGDRQTWDTMWPFPLAVLAGFYALHTVFTWGRVWYWLKRGLAGVSELSMKV